MRQAVGMTPSLTVVDQGRELTFTFDDLLRYHGPHSPGGLAHAFKVLERAFAVLAPDAPPQRRELRIVTAFGGPGARDGFEMVTRAVTGERFRLDPSLARPELGRARERFVFEVADAGGAVTLVLREGFVSDEFIDLARRDDRSAQDERRLTELKWQMAQRLMETPAAAVYDAQSPAP